MRGWPRGQQSRPESGSTPIRAERDEATHPRGKRDRLWGRSRSGAEAHAGRGAPDGARYAAAERVPIRVSNSGKVWATQPNSACHDVRHAAVRDSRAASGFYGARCGRGYLTTAAPPAESCRRGGTFSRAARSMSAASRATA
jgi:hypothetical protein